MTDEDCEDYPDEQSYFVGCTCEHDEDQHGWGHCDMPGCDCEGGWEE